MTIKHSKLFTAVAMVLVAALALGTATFAWFINNTKVESENMNFQASTSSGLEIAIHDDAIVNNQNKGANALDYKGILTIADILKYNTAMNKNNKLELTTVSTVTCGAFYMTGIFNKDKGYADLFHEAVAGTEYLMVPFWIRASEDMNLYISSDTAITIGNDTTKSSEYFNKILRVGFHEMDGATGETFTNSLIYEPDEEKSTLGNRESTTYDYVMGNKITEEGMGIKALNNTGNAIAFEKQNALTGSAVLVTEETAKNEIIGGAGTTGKTHIATLEKGIPQKIILYVWLDGMDFDCVSGITGVSGATPPPLLVDLKMIGVKAKK